MAGGFALWMRPAGCRRARLRRRLSSVSGLFAYLLARGDVTANPVPRGLPTRREQLGQRQRVALVRRPRTLPRVLDPAEVDALLAALRTHRDRAMVDAMLLGGLRRCEVLGLRLDDSTSATGGCSSPTARAASNGACTISGRFFTALSDYLDTERPADAATDGCSSC